MRQLRKSVNLTLPIFLTLFALLTIVLSRVAPLHAEEVMSDAPYLYYYSGNGFVIERADGSDSRVLGNGLTPTTEYMNFVDAAWSPSGQWLAWTSNSWGCNPPGRICPAGSANVIRSDGSQRLTTFDSWGGGVTLQWVENTDLLFAAQQTFEIFPETLYDEGFSVGGMVRVRFALVDVTTGHTLFDVSDSIKADEGFDVSPVLVRRIGQQIIAEYRIPTSNSRKKQRVFRVFGMDGTWYEVKRDRVPNNYWSDSESATAGEWIVYSNGEYTYAENMLSGETMRFSQPLDEFAVSWSPNGQRVLLWEKRDIRLSNLWLLDLTAKRLSRLQHSIDVDAAELAERYWSPDSRYFALRTGDFDAEHIQLFDTVNLTAQIIRMPQFSSGYGVGMLWSQDNRLGITWFSQQRAPDRHFVYTPATHQLVEVTQSEGVHLPATISPDGKRAAHGGVDYELIIDLRTGEVRRVRPPAILSPYGLYGEEFIWHSDSRWLLFSYEGESGSYFNNFYVSIIDSDNGTLRDLAFHDKPLPYGANWLPPQVDPTTLPPVLDQAPFRRPDHILYGTVFVDALEWSPDSTRIADVSPFVEWSLQNSIAVWDVATGERVQRISGVNQMNDIVWGEDERVHLTMRTEPEDPYLGVIATSPDGSLVAVVDDDGVRVQDAETDEVMCIILDWRPFQLLNFKFSPDSRIAIFEHSELWDVQTCRVLTGVSNATDAEFSPDGKWLATTASWDIQLWDVEKLLHPYMVGEGE
jgi:WD40 repeat protein